MLQCEEGVCRTYLGSLRAVGVTVGSLQGCWCYSVRRVYLGPTSVAFRAVGVTVGGGCI